MRKALWFLVATLVPLVTSAQVRRAWVETWPGPDNYSLGRGLTLDDSGNVYLAGQATIGGSFAGVIVKFAPDRRLLWHKITSGMPIGVVADDSGNVYVAGTFYSGSTSYLELAKFLSNGHYDWSRYYGGAGASDIELDRTGNVYVTGWVKAGSPPKYSYLTMKYTSSGDLRWAVADTAESYIENVHLAVNDAGVYVCVPFRGITYVAAYGLDGTHRWLRRHGSMSGYTAGFWGDIAVDKTGIVYFTSCKPRDATPALADCLVGAYTGDGGFLWEDIWSCSTQGISTGGSIAADDSVGGVFVTGLYIPDFTINVKRSMTMKYTPQGNRPWLRTYVGEGEWDCCYDIASDRHGNAYAAGFTDEADSGSVCLLIKYGPTGDVKWVEKYAVVPGDNVWASMFVDRSDNVYLGGSVTTTWTPYTIILAAAKYSQKGRFQPARDGWQFTNAEESIWPQTWWSQFDYTKPPFLPLFSLPPINATSADFPDWPLFVDVFGVDQCYKKAADGIYYFNPLAILTWRCAVMANKELDSLGNVTSHWMGSCYGFALSALRYYNDYLSLKKTLGDAENVHAVPIGDESRLLINRHQITLKGNPHREFFRSTPWASGSELLVQLRTMLDEEYRNNRVLCLADSGGMNQHAVVACSLAAAAPGFVELAIYDPNFPGEYRFLNYSEVDETWTSPDFQTPTVRTSLMNPVEAYNAPPVLPTEVPMAATMADAIAESLPSTFNSPYADIRIRGSGGVIGFANGALIDSLPGARPWLDFVEKARPPSGYFLPTGEYSVEIDGSRDHSTSFAAFLGSAALSFHRVGSTPDESELLRFSTASRGLSVANPDPAAKPLFLQSIESSGGEETVCRLHVQNLPNGDSVGIQLVGERNVQISSGEQGMDVDLRLELAKDYSNPVFEYDGLPLEGGASYLVAPVWDSLATIPLLVIVDRGSNGTPDDTLRLENQTTALEQGNSGKIPKSFELHQNYPNPFNSATIITFELPVASDVRLSVYDMLGREVKVLVNERKHAGVHAAPFDASALASGVYVYRLAAGDFAQSRKLVLLR